MPSRKPTRPTDGRLKANRPARTTPVRPKTRWQQLIDGDITVDDLDDEEILAGKVKDYEGKFRGRPPKMVPRQINDAMRAAFHERIEGSMREDFELARATLKEVMQSKHAAAPARVRAAEIVYERVLGKVTDKVAHTVELKPYEQDIDDLLVDVNEEGVHTITTMPRKGEL